MPFSACLVDTNILLRANLLDRSDNHAIRSALTKLLSDGTVLYFTHQNIAEFWNAATRPIENNGFGLSPEEAGRQVDAFERGMQLLPENAAVYGEWRRLVALYDVRGLQVHDARLVAAMVVHGITHVLTLNTKHFARFQEVIPIHPTAV